MAAPIFQADFEDSLTATKAGGSPEGQASGIVEYVEGFSGKAAVLSNKHRLHYSSKGNIRLESGTILLWIKPLNWSWQTDKFVEFFRLDDPEDRSSLLLYKYMKPAADFGLVFLAGRQLKVGDTPQWTTTKKRIKTEGTNQWTLLAATWDQSTRLINLYVNGEQIAYATLPENQLPSSLAESFFVLHTNKTPLDDTFQTAIDTLTIDDRSLTAEEIRSYYERTRRIDALVPSLDPASIPPSALSIPRLATPPEIDGHYGANEWTEAATASGFSVFARPRSPADRQTVVHIGYDDKFLYLAWLTPIPPGKPPLANADTHDDLKIGRDDAVEVIISPEGGATFQWLINTKNVSSDLKGEHFAKLDKSWNSKARFSGKVYEARWLCEMAIPLDELGGAPTDGQRWKINFCRDWAQAAESGGTFATSWSFAAKSFASDLGSAIFRQAGVSAGLTIDPKAMEDRRIAGQLDIRNASQQDQRDLRVEVDIVSASGEVTRSANQKLLLGAGQQIAHPFDLPVEDPTSLARFKVSTAANEEIFSHTMPLEYPAGLVISPLVRADTKSAEVNVQLGGLKTAHDNLTARVLLRDSAGKTLQSAPLELAKSQTSGRSTLDLGDIPDGEYGLRVEVSSDGKAIADATKTFEKMLDPIWLKEKPGVSRKVLPPWTPMTSQGGFVECWGRTYQFGTSLLPVQIQSAGTDLLAHPASIKLKTEPANETKPVTFYIVEAAEDRVIVKAEQAGSQISLQTVTTIEYDGVAKVELTVTPKVPGTKIQNLQIHLPLHSFPETLLHAHSFAWSDMIRKRLPVDFRSKFFPYLWIGSEARGLAWFTESDQNWNITNTNNVVSAPTSHGVIDWSITLIDHPTTLDQPVTYVFGLQATPVKPPLPARRSLRLHQPAMTHILPWAMRDKSLKKYQPEDKEWGWLAPQIGNYDGFRREIDSWREKGISLPVYVAPTITSPQSPSYQLFKESWRNPHGSYPFACAAATFTDELVWNVDHMIKESGMESIYIDCAWAYSCGNHAHGCGYKSPDGKTRLTYPIFALRDELKRIYTLIHHKNSTPRALVWAHASGLAAAPIHSFVDVLTQGEEVRTEITANPDYLDIYSLDDWRITYGPGLGIEMNFLPEFADPSIKTARFSPEKNATFVSLALLHDTSLQDGFSDPAYLKRVYEILDQEGLRDKELRFLPYWDQQAVTAPENTAVKISVYTLPTHALAIVVNPTSRAEKATLSFNESTLGWNRPITKVEEILPTRRSYTLDTPIEVPAKNYLVLKLTPNP